MIISKQMGKKVKFLHLELNSIYYLSDKRARILLLPGRWLMCGMCTHADTTTEWMALPITNLAIKTVQFQLTNGDGDVWATIIHIWSQKQVISNF